MKFHLITGDALLIVDAQYDFFPGGALPVPKGDEIIPILNTWIKAAVAARIPIFASRDWHDPKHCSFVEQGGPWPAHCVQDSEGAQIHKTLALPQQTIVINKAQEAHVETYSAFGGETTEGSSLTDTLHAHHVKRIWIHGLALDYCVVETALDGIKYGFEVHVVVEGTRAITPETGEDALVRMRTAGVILH